MTELILPDPDRFEEWAALVEEDDDPIPHGSGLWMVPLGVGRESFEEHLRLSALFAEPSAALPGDKVHCDQFWIADGPDLVGFLQIRHRLNDWLLNEGGHIGYSVRPSRRRQGHASRALGLALVRSKELGLDRVLVTCEEANVASARTIESRGGVLEDVRNGKRRYWIAT
jgi:predicted acetyltransferase